MGISCAPSPAPAQNSGILPSVMIHYVQKGQGKIMIYRVNDFGAAGDGSHNDTAAIQAAIDTCCKNGGGKVVLDGGRTYRAGTLVLRSHVELHLEMGAALKASDHLEDFNLPGRQAAAPSGLSQPTYEDCEYTGQPSLYFIYAKDCEYVSITGFGTIDGNEEIFYGTVTPWHIDGSFYPRVPLLFMEHIEHLSITHVTLTGSAFWTTHMVGCDDVLIDGIRILNNLRLANCDGIDPDHCKNVRITNCHIECADDCIVFKNTAHAMQYGGCENIVVSGCTLVSTSAAIKFGTESEAPFRNIIVQNCNISRTNRGISLQLRDSGCIENVIFSNINIDTRLFSKIYWWGEAEPIAVTAVHRKDGTQVGTIRNVTFSHIHCTGENGILIHGDGDCNISDIAFEDISLRLAKRTDWPKNFHDLRPCEGNTILEGSLNAVFARNAKNVTFSGLKVTIDENMKEYMEQPFDISDCENFCLPDRENPECNKR